MCVVPFSLFCVFSSSLDRLADLFSFAPYHHHHSLQIVSTKILENDLHVWIVSWRTQEILAYRDLKTGEITQGADDKIETCGYVAVLTRIEDELDDEITGGWKIIDVSRSSSFFTFFRLPRSMTLSHLPTFDVDNYIVYPIAWSITDGATSGVTDGICHTKDFTFTISLSFPSLPLSSTLLYGRHSHDMLSVRITQLTTLYTLSSVQFEFDVLLCAFLPSFPICSFGKETERASTMDRLAANTCTYVDRICERST